MAKSKTATAPVLENEHVQELLTILRENNAPTTQDFLAIINQIDSMERQLDAAVQELAAMRRELNAAREQTHPVKNALQNAVKTLDKNTATLRERLDEVKRDVIDCCKNAVAAFREKGISALNNITRFFKVRPILESMRGSINRSIALEDKMISTIEAVSIEYHQAGKHLRNMARAMTGQEAVQDVKPVGKLAKAMEAPLKANLACFAAMKKSVETALSRIAVLEKAAERKPSIQKTMQSLNEQIAQGKKDAPTVDRPRPSRAER